MQRTPAVVLRRVDYSETSQVIHLFTRDGGKVHGIAKGAKRKKSAFLAPFDLFTEYEIVRYEKKRGELDILSAAEILRDFGRLRRDYDRFCIGSYILELIDELTLQGPAQPEIYSLLIGAMVSLDEGATPAGTVFRFEARLVGLLGLAPRTSQCGLCQRPITGREAFFSCRDGGAVCPRCRPRDPRRVLVPAEVFGVLKRYGDPETPVKLNRAWVDPLRRVLDDYIRHVMEKEPKSMRFMRKAVIGK